jgi:hypothetical protein
MIIINIIITIIVTVSLLAGGLACGALLEILGSRSADFFKFKLKNVYFSVALVIFYLIFFVLIFYVIRILNIRNDQFLDINKLFIRINFIYLTYLPHSKFLVLCCLLICLMSILLFILIMLIVNKFFFRHLYMLYFYFAYGSQFGPLIRYKILDLSYLDVLSYILFYAPCLRMIINYGFREGLNAPFDKNYLSKMPWYLRFYLSIAGLLTSREFQRGLTWSPFYFMLSDCATHDFVLRWTSLYLLFYVPLILIRRATYSAFCHSRAVAIMLVAWEVYYGKEKQLYAIPSKSLKYLDYIFLTQGLLPDNPYGEELPSYMVAGLAEHMVFIQDEDNPRIFINIEEISLLKSKDGRYFYIIGYDVNNRNHAIVGEEYKLIADKT